jgi:hypothetical protein
MALTPAAHALVAYCLEAAADELLDLYAGQEAWNANFPRLSACFRHELAQKVVLGLREKLDRPEEYLLTDYHWLLRYEVMQVYVDLIKDHQLPDILGELQAVATAEDSAYLEIHQRSLRSRRVQLDLDGFIDKFLWDTVFHTEPQLFEQLDSEAKQRLATNPELFGVIQRLALHPDELILQPSLQDHADDEGRTDEPA